MNNPAATARIHHFYTTVVCYSLILVAILLIRESLIHFRAGFVLILLAAIGGLVVTGLSLRRLLNGQTRGRRDRVLAWLSLTASPLPFLVLLVKFVTVSQMPMIHDISTDTANPPILVTAATLRRPSDHSVNYDQDIAPLQQQAYPKIQPLRTSDSTKAVADKVHQFMRARGWEIVSPPGQELIIEAVVTSDLFRFKDDIVVRLKPLDRGTLVDIRSASRVGKSDLGANADRIRDLLDYLKQAH